VADALAEPVARFIDDLAPAMASVAHDLPGVDADKLRADVTVEAFNLAAAFIDCDGLHTDDELWAFIAAFAPRVDTQLGLATPLDVRKAGLIAGKRAYLEAPSVLFDILVRADKRNNTVHSSTYYVRAMEIAFSVAAVDLHTSTTELNTIETFRGMLLRTMELAGVPRPGQPRPASTGPVAKEATTPPGTTPGVTPVPPPEADEPPRPLEDLLRELDELVGLREVKAEVKLVTNLIQVEKLRRERDLPVLEQSRHLVFTGNPGTGKTTVARLLAQIYRTLGVVKRGHLVESDRSQLVAGFVGQTATQVKAVFDSADEGVLLIDEAYALVRGGERDFGREAIDTIVKLVEDRRDSIVVIVAGYPEEMAEFVDANPGLRSRFPKTIFFPDYSNDELMQIFESLGKKGRYVCDAEARAKVQAWFEAQPRTKGFGNGRLARNMFEAAVARQASRIVTIDNPTDEQLTTLTAADIPDLGPEAAGSR
jgi:Cdc6-like AAA superfamily ATPase